jgi:hypothetical protein
MADAVLGFGGDLSKDLSQLGHLVGTKLADIQPTLTHPPFCLPTVSPQPKPPLLAAASSFGKNARLLPIGPGRGIFHYMINNTWRG